MVRGVAQGWRHLNSAEFAGFGNVAVTKSLIFVIDNRRTVSMLLEMSADKFYRGEAVDALRFLFQSALGIWR